MSDTALTTESAALPLGPSWQDQDVILREMWMQNKTPPEISEALGRSVSAIMTRAARLGLPRRAAPGRKPGRQPMGDGASSANGTATGLRETRRVSKAASTVLPVEQTVTTAPRICLMCLTTFQSAGRHNRICATCKGSAEYASASTLADIHLPNS